MLSERVSLACIIPWPYSIRITSVKETPESFNSRPEQTSTTLLKKQSFGCLKNIILNLAGDILACWCFFPPSYYLYSFTQLLDFITVSKYPFGASQHKGNRTQTWFFPFETSAFPEHQVIRRCLDN